MNKIEKAKALLLGDTEEIKYQEEINKIAYNVFYRIEEMFYENPENIKYFNNKTFIEKIESTFNQEINSLYNDILSVETYVKAFQSIDVVSVIVYKVNILLKVDQYVEYNFRINKSIPKII